MCDDDLIGWELDDVLEGFDVESASEGIAIDSCGEPRNPLVDEDVRAKLNGAESPLVATFGDGASCVRRGRLASIPCDCKACRGWVEALL